MTPQTDDNKPGIEEKYTCAMSSSKLRVEAERPGDIDLVIAAGWNQSRIGGALLRLHTEWDSSEKPRMATFEHFLPGIKSGTSKERKAQAHAMTHKHNLHEMGLLLGKLKALPDVRLQVTLQLLRWNIQDAKAKGSLIVHWWLAQTCPVCSGTKFQVVEGSNRHSAKVCRTCGGTGLREIPHGNEGRRCANWLDQCVERARASMCRRLSGWEKTGTRYIAPD